MFDPVPEGAECFFEECPLPPVAWSTNPAPIILEDEDGRIVKEFAIGEADVVLCNDHLKEEP